MLIKPRIVYRPFEYPQCFEFARRQQMVHWLETEIPMASDIQDWKYSLTESEKLVIGKILKGFTQAEVLVGDYWRQVANWFPKPEVAQMASVFSYFETIHQTAYALLNDTLGLDDWEAFITDEETAAKLDNLINVQVESLDTLDVQYFITDGHEYYPNDIVTEKLQDIATSLAIFSAFTEGVQIFSSFAVLLSFQKKNLMKGVGQIVSFSVRDGVRPLA